ncbi:MAG: bifunctional 5,10-methylenetetrahydrofolate dehydrogenase/5,10-methenyltetrahydrofolate cyclohydrolase [Endomicrobium sp.]|jgi:methylenetetrahydrofolate dehydrogenase (NADP+)/methenyltetrahydrofolate cyclohydrolase|nr:bifunctional 5,10-methylenetetrahydrofolate dehydrogenase/5,10-methenyltetrahydrofolate cyclohydrolase [Endomicrobium sp.]
MDIIEGKTISIKRRAKLKEEIIKIKNMTGKNPGLATVLVGDNPASKVYISSKIKACKEVGIESFHHDLSSNSSEKTVINLINDLNKNKEINGILIQLPLPKQEFTRNCINSIDPLKDVDGIHPFNIGLLDSTKNWIDIVKQNLLIPCTPLGIMHLLKYYNISMTGKTALIIGRSNLVGKPMANLLLANNATVIMAHSKTKKLKELCKTADIVIVSIGKPNFINKEFIKNNSIVVDVGINRNFNGLCGDVDFNSVKNMDIKITPVPGGVGPMTITSLLENTLKAFITTNMIKSSIFA